MAIERDPTDLDGIEQAQSDKAKKAQVAAKLDAEDLRWLMANKRGRRIVWRMLSDAGVYRLSFNTNAMLMAFNEGVRSEGLKMTAQIMAVCPDLYMQMTEDNT